MKQVINNLNAATIILEGMAEGGRDENGLAAAVLDIVKEAIAELATPRWYTPEQYRERTGEPWPDNGLVYCLDVAWMFGVYQWAKNWHPHCPVVCATEAGPPPDGWRPEDNRQ